MLATFNPSISEMNNYRHLPSLLGNLIFILFALSTFVAFEPAPFDIFFVLTLLAFIILGAIKIPTNLVMIITLLYLYTLVSLFSIMNTLDVNHGVFFFSVTTYLIILSIFISSIVGIYGIKAVDLIFKAIILSSIISCIISVLSYFNILPFYDLVTRHNIRLKGFFKDPNVLGPSINMVVIYCLYFVNKEQVKHKLIYWALIALFIFTVFLTYSRAAWGTLAIAIFTYYGLLLFTGRKKIIKKIMVAGILLTVIMFIMGTLIVSFGFSEIIISRFTSNAYDLDRFYVHNLLLENSLEYILGAGPGQVDVWLGHFYNHISGSNSAHNTTLRVFFENGFIGVFLYLIFIIWTLFAGLRLSLKKWQFQELSAAFVTIYLSYIISSLVIDTLHWRCFWIATGIIWGMKVMYARQYNNKSHKILI